MVNGKCQVNFFVLCHHISTFLVFPISVSLSVQLSAFQKALVGLPKAAATPLLCLPFASSILPPGMQPDELGNGWQLQPKGGISVPGALAEGAETDKDKLVVCSSLHQSHLM